MPAGLDALEAIPGVRAAVPLVQAPAGLVTPAGPEPLLVLGVDPGRDGAVRDYRVVQGADLARARGLLLEAGFAARHGCAVGRPVRLVTPRGPVEVEVAGLLAGAWAARFNGGAVAVLPLAQAQALFAAPGEVNAVQLVLERGADPERVRRAVEERLPGRAVRRPGGEGQLAGEFLVSIEQMMRALSAFAVVAGALVILNTFLMHLGERQRQIALLRALGATRRQVAGLLVRQALLLGGAGTLLGLPLGVLLAAALVRVNEHYLGLPLPPLRLSPGPLLLAGLLGPAMTLAATVVPARKAARRPPLAGLALRGGLEPDPPAAWPAWVGVTLLAGVLLYEVAVIRGWLSPEAGTALIPLFAGASLLGCSCLLPALLPPLLRAAGWAVPPLLGAEGRLALRQLSRQRARTGLTVGVLFAAVTASVAFGMSFLNNLRDLDVWFARTIDSDFFVRAVPPDPVAIVTPAPLPPSAAEDVRGLPGCAWVGKFRFVPTHVDGVAALLVAREVPDAGPLPLMLHQGDPDEVRAALARGEVVLGSALARRLGVAAGDEITLPSRSGARRVRVAGIAKEYGAGGLALYADWGPAARWFGFRLPHGLSVTARPGEGEELAAALGDYCRERALLLQPNRDFAAAIYRVVAGVRVLVVGMVALVFLVAAVGVVNTLTTNVLDQTRELGVLRALGMTRRQLRKLVLAQAAVLALVSCLPGAPAGVLLSYLMNRATPGLIGHIIPFRLEAWLVLACVAGVAALAALAALLPARRAARLAVIDALRYE
jgi:putative ABC transport system permease protein